MDGNVAAVAVAGIGIVPATLAWLSSRKTHREVRTNHGIRAGQRLEDLTDDMVWVRSNMSGLKTDFEEHAASDKEFQDRVEPLLAAREKD